MSVAVNVQEDSMVETAFAFFFVLALVAPPAAVVIGLLLVSIRWPCRRGDAAAQVPAHV